MLFGQTERKTKTSVICLKKLTKTKPLPQYTQWILKRIAHLIWFLILHLSQIKSRNTGTKRVSPLSPAYLISGFIQLPKPPTALPLIPTGKFHGSLRSESDQKAHEYSNFLEPMHENHGNWWPDRVTYWMAGPPELLLCNLSRSWISIFNVTNKRSLIFKIKFNLLSLSSFQ